MPSESTRAPKLLKGALAVYPSQARGTQPKIIGFQYNPDQIRRTLQARSQPPDKTNAGAAREEVLRVLGPPVETINMTVELSAIDQLENPDANRTVAQKGLRPALAALELLLYPSTNTVQKQQAQAQSGKVQVTPGDLPLVLLVWSSAIVAPVLITNFSVTEEAFDVNLNPIRVKLELALKVLTHMELDKKSLGYDAYLAYQRQKETLSQQDQPRGGEDRVRGFLPT